MFIRYIHYRNMQFLNNVIINITKVSQFIRYSRACGSYQNFLDRGLLLKRKLLKEGFLLVKIKSLIRKCYRSSP